MLLKQHGRWDQRDGFRRLVDASIGELEAVRLSLADPTRAAQFLAPAVGDDPPVRGARRVSGRR
jgi:hypothetical protein